MSETDPAARAFKDLCAEMTVLHGRMLATVLAGITEFERDLISERVKSGLVAARARGKVLALVAEKRSYRWIARDLGSSKSTVAAIVHRER